MADAYIYTITGVLVCREARMDGLVVPGVEGIDVQCGIMPLVNVPGLTTLSNFSIRAERS